jgi:triphosphoribosyl-dephospho-CoA synthetase
MERAFLRTLYDLLSLRSLSVICKKLNPRILNLWLKTRAERAFHLMLLPASLS